MGWKDDCQQGQNKRQIPQGSKGGITKSRVWLLRTEGFSTGIPSLPGLRCDVILEMSR